MLPLETSLISWMPNWIDIVCSSYCSTYHLYLFVYLSSIPLIYLSVYVCVSHSLLSLLSGKESVLVNQCCHNKISAICRVDFWREISPQIADDTISLWIELCGFWKAILIMRIWFLVEFDSGRTQICYFVLTKSLLETKEHYQLILYLTVDGHFILVANISFSLQRDSEQCLALIGI